MTSRQEEKLRRREERLQRERDLATPGMFDDRRSLLKWFASAGVLAIIINLLLLAAAVAIVCLVLSAFGVI